MDGTSVFGAVTISPNEYEDFELWRRIHLWVFTL